MERIGDCELYLGDCRDVLPALSFDSVVTDPPYGIGETSKKASTRGQLAKPRDYGEHDWDMVRPDDIVLNLLSSRYQVIFGGNYFALPPTSCWLIWDKLNTGDFADCEMAWTNLSKAIRRIQWRWNGMIRQGKDTERFHPTQKPIEVMEWCISHLPADHGVICDPFMGSGTTGVACAKAGKRFIGIERDARYFDIACERIEKAYMQDDMFISSVTDVEQESLWT